MKQNSRVSIIRIESPSSHPMRAKALRRYISFCAVALIACCAFSSSALAQNSSDRGTPSESKVGQSGASTYARDKIETVNLANGNFSLSIPLATVGGRGSASFTIALSYNSKVWSAQDDPDPASNCQAGATCVKLTHHTAMYEKIIDQEPYLQHLGGGWTITLAPGIKAKMFGIDPLTTGCTSPTHDCGFKYVLTKMWLTLPDGSQVELRDNATDGAPALSPVTNGYHQPTEDRGRLWHSFDGSNVTFVRDSNDTVSSYPDSFLPSGWVFLPDGTRLRMDAGVCSKIIDSDGNYITISGGTYTDELGRQATVQTANGTVTVTANGYMGTPDRSMTINTGALGDHLRADFNNSAVYPRPFTTGDAMYDWQGNHYDHMISGSHTDLFSDSEGIIPYGPEGKDVGAETAVTQLNLLDGRSFQFHYNQYGEVAEIIYPGGGVSQVDYYGYVTSICEVRSPIHTTLNRRVIQRRSLTDGVKLDATWIYTKGFGTLNGTNYPTVTVEAHQGNSTDTLLSSETHFFYSFDAEDRPCSGPITGTSDELWNTAKEFRTETQTGSRTVVTTRNWYQDAFHWPTGSAYLTDHTQPQIANNPRVTYEDTILEDGKMKRVEYGYDQFNNVTSIKEYDFGTEGNPGTLLRETDRQYLGSGTTPSLNGYCYTNLNPSDSSCGNGLATDINTIIYQRHLLLNETIKDGQGNQKAYTEYEYDNYSGANHAAIVSNSGMINYDGSRFSSFNSQHEPRGNVTKVSRWAGGTSYITAYSQYDNAGNVIWAKDPRGNVSTISYADNFGDGSNPESGASGTNGATYALPTVATNASSQQAKSQYSYTLGAVTGVKDLNGVIAKTEYDSIGRPVKAIAALGLAEQVVTEMIYPTASSNVSMVSKQLDATRWLASKVVMDGFDRAVTAYQAEDGQKASSANFTIQSETSYDGLGRVIQVSNPYRPGAQESPLNTTTEYDLAGRVTKVKTPDNAEVNSYYNGTQTLVKDQAGKERMSETNALGQLSTVWEITTGDDTEAVTFPNHSEVSAGYKTKYEYDALGNLTKVTQQRGTAGTTQTRSFAYDSLSRLTSATNPESGTITYQYDANGNLVLKIDPRLGRTRDLTCSSVSYTGNNIATCYEYDELNRVKTRAYNNDTPDVTYTYDTSDVAYSTGRLTSVSSSVSATNYIQFDALGRVKASSQVTDGVTYSMPEYNYNLAGNLTSEKYPSGRVITTGYDNAGRLSSVTGQMGTTSTPYASDFAYTSHGAVKDMKLGNNLYEHASFNNRLQPTELDLGTTQGGIDRLKLEYAYGTTNNNGNVQSQTITVPGLTNPLVQTYTYDDLNRLKSATEMSGSNQSWKQTFIYDRYGNRRFDTDNTSAGMASSLLVADPLTNKLASGQGSVHYDNAGNLDVDFNGHAFAYDAENKQVRYDGGAAAGGTDYKYDGDGRRVKKVSGTGQQTTVFVYDAMGQLVAEYDTAPPPPGSGGTRYFTEDNLGTPRIITGSDQSVKARHDYLPFGEEIQANDLDSNVPRKTAQKYIGSDDKVRQKFTQKERDVETGLDYFEARYYSSTQGRFTSPDSLGGRPINPQTLNLYSYVRNNPLRYNDPTGHSPQDPKKHPKKSEPAPPPTPYNPDCGCYPYGNDDTFRVVTNQKKNEPVIDPFVMDPHLLRPIIRLSINPPPLRPLLHSYLVSRPAPVSYGIFFPIGPIGPIEPIGPGTFGEGDMALGVHENLPSFKGNARIGTDVPNPNAEELIDVILRAAKETVENGGKIRFNLDDVDDMSAFTPGSKFYDTVTSEELRRVLSDPVLKENTIFYRDGQEVPPPQ
jgi:RHS repeat-associated protein